MAPRSKVAPAPAPVKKSTMKRRQTSALLKIGNRTADALERPQSIKEWDDEELERGYRKDKNGRFTGRPPRVVPMECFRELTRRQLERAQKAINDSTGDMVKVLEDIANDPNADSKARVTAAKLLLERSLGKVPETLKLQADTPKWIGALEAGVVSVDVPEYDGDEIIDVDWEESA